MPKRYNPLNDLKTNPYEIGICPICSVRLTYGCEHSQTQLYQEWLAAVIVAEQGYEIVSVQMKHVVNERTPYVIDSQPYTSITPSADELAKRYDWTPCEDMPVNFDIDKIGEIKF